MLRLMLKYGSQQPAGTTKPRLEESQGVADRDFSWRDDAGVDSDCLIQLANDVTNYRTIFWNVLSNTTRNHDATWARLQELNRFVVAISTVRIVLFGVPRDCLTRHGLEQPA